MIREILTDENPLLRQISVQVGTDEDVREIVRDMIDTMRSANGCGLAAPQIGILKRIIVVQPSPEEQIKILINPEIFHRSAVPIVGVEGCLSVRERMCVVERPELIAVEFNVRRNGAYEKDTAYFDGFEARIVCHEIDHLDGILMMDRAV